MLVHFHHLNAVEKLMKDMETTNTKPLWAQMTKLNPPLPNPKTTPHIWKYKEIRPHLLKAGELITEKQAQRRVLMLVNPSRGRWIFLLPVLLLRHILRFFSSFFSLTDIQLRGSIHHRYSICRSATSDPK